MNTDLTADLAQDIAAAGNTYRWRGHHRRLPAGATRRGFFVGTAAGTGLVIAAIAFPVRPEETSQTLFMDPPPAITEPEPEHDPLADCLTCTDPPPVVTAPTEPVQVRPTNPPPYIEPPLPFDPPEGRHRRIEPVFLPPATPTTPPVPPTGTPPDPVTPPPPEPPPVTDPTPPAPEPTGTTPTIPNPPDDDPTPPPMPPPDDETTEPEPTPEETVIAAVGGQPVLRALR